MLLLQFSTSFLNSACLAAKKSVGQRKKSSVIISPPIYKRKSNIFGSTLFILLFTVFFYFCSFAVFAFVLWVLQFYLHFVFEALFCSQCWGSISPGVVWRVTNIVLFVAAKGRTNVELREQFTLASGVSQSMTPFKSKPRGDRGESPTSSVSGDTRNGMQGPITKVSSSRLTQVSLFWRVLVW